MPANPPFISADDYDVVVRLLQDPRGTLLVESESETRRKYAELVDDAHIRYAAEPEKELTDQLARFEAAEAQEIDLFRQLEEQRGDDITAYTFKFRVATIADHEAAEAEAAKQQPRQDLVYRRELAQRTFKETDYPGFTSFLALKTGVALHVMRQVAERVMLTQNARDFLLKPGKGSAAG